jgi:hypothetical protein
MSDFYETDFVLWAEQQADALHRRAANEIDWENVAEEIGILARSDRRDIHNRLAVICSHLLKWTFQRGLRSRSWRRSIIEARDQIANLVEESPSLGSYPVSRLAKAYADGYRIAELETGLADLPKTCPWTIDQVLSHNFMPDVPTPIP